MNHLQGAGEAQCVGGLAADRFAGGQGKDRTQSLAASQKAVAHRLKQARSRTGDGDHAAVQRTLHEPSTLFKVALDIESGRGIARSVKILSGPADRA